MPKDNLTGAPMTLPRCLALALAIACATTLLARPGTIRTRDGRSIEGDITEKPDGSVAIATKAGTVTLSGAEVETISYAGNIKEEYKKRLANLPKNAGAKDHLTLARWLYDNREYELARTELDTTLAIDPNNAEAVTLR